MPRPAQFRVACLSALVAVWGVGCGDTNPSGTTGTTGTSATTSTAVTTTEKDHGHKDGDHEDEHGHPDKGPHEGVLVMFEGHAAHLEIVFDAKTGTITAWPVDAHAEKALPVTGDEIQLVVVPKEEPVEVTLKRAEGDKFVGQADALKGVEKWKGTVTKVTIDGKEYAETVFKYPEGNHEH